MNVLVDTNVVVSAALRDRLPERVVLFITTSDHCRWLVTTEILDEYLGVLRRPKFKLDVETIDQWTSLLALRTVQVGSPPILPTFPRDPKDVPFLAAALFSQADLLVTGDRDLLNAHGIVPTRIISAAQFAAEFIPPDWTC